ncbi:hypothetical protein HYPSUDRAFT_39597 [Hypholoma sublateritium FD-334 SS-4]|uniref:Uncharacterized protein n=1 Tax=Hypholoma sublateritium (strain FD-334 SS-4) TaxID=945553 RepID=A0A0D2P554_HYPSF|nr:hypothetical protein HYPSUDRAFT_39597 [Hypholoma sublateritium FD-334 SS-4]
MHLPCSARSGLHLAASCSHRCCCDIHTRANLDLIERNGISWAVSLGAVAPFRIAIRVKLAPANWSVNTASSIFSEYPRSPPSWLRRTLDSKRRVSDLTWITVETFECHHFQCDETSTPRGLVNFIADIPAAYST